MYLMQYFFLHLLSHSVEQNNKNYIIRQSGERIALNTPIQGSSADIIKLAMIEIHKKLNEEHFKSKMVLQIHDELVFDVCIDEKEKLEQLVKDIMENCYKLDVPLVVEMYTTDEEGNEVDLINVENPQLKVMMPLLIS